MNAQKLLANLFGVSTRILWPMPSLHLLYYYRILDKHLRFEPSDIVLDIGCGTGHLASYISKRARIVYGLDISQQLISRLAAHNSASLSFCCADICKCKNADFVGRFSKIYSVHAFEHVLEVRSFFGAVCDFLSDDGVACIIFPNSHEHGERCFLKLSELKGQIADSGLNADIWIMRATRGHRLVRSGINMIKRAVKNAMLIKHDDSKSSNEFDQTLYYNALPKTKYLRRFLSFVIYNLLFLLRWYDFYHLSNNDDIVGKEMLILLRKNARK